MSNHHATLALAVLLLLPSGCFKNKEPEDASNPANPKNFRAALESGDAKRVLQSIQAGADVNARLYGELPLFIAAKAGGREALEAVLDRCRDPKVLNAQGCSALHLAGSRGAAELLIERKLVVDLPDRLGETPLHKAADAGLADVVDLLLEKGADPKARAMDGATMPLNLAASRAVAERLVKGGAPVWGGEPDRRGHSSLPPLWTAALRGRADVAGYLREKGFPPPPPRGRDEYLWRALSNAVQGRHAAVVSAIFERSKNISQKDHDDLLVKAVLKSDIETVRVFLTKGLRSIDGCSEPLIKAAANGNPEMLQVILDNGGRATAASASGFTPLHAAAQKVTPRGAKMDHLACLRLLLERGASARAATTLSFQTPLHLAAAADFVEGATLLIQAGADVNAPDQLGATPLHWAVARDARKTAGMLICSGANPKLIIGPQAASQKNYPGEAPNPCIGKGFAGATALSLARSDEMKALLAQVAAVPAATPGTGPEAPAQMQAPAPFPVERIRTGTSEQELIATLGEPNGRFQIGGRTVFNYDGGSITLEAGRVTSVTPRQQSIDRK